jgi:hypothetical protein
LSAETTASSAIHAYIYRKGRTFDTNAPKGFSMQLGGGQAEAAETEAEA